MQLVAFLRGINVGGRVAKKEELLKAFASAGCRNVEAFRQSGNVIFETNSANLGAVTGRIEDELRKTLGYDVPVFIRTFNHLEKLAEKGSRYREEEGTSLLVTFLPASTPSPTLSLPLTIPKSAAEIVSAYGSEVFSLTHGGGEGGLPNPFLESKLKVKTTTRNMNVVKEIVQKYGRSPARTP
jgi:uncharacterized protein (DUF1697 family)